MVVAAAVVVDAALEVPTVISAEVVVALAAVRVAAASAAALATGEQHLRAATVAEAMELLPLVEPMEVVLTAVAAAAMAVVEVPMAIPPEVLVATPGGKRHD